MEKFVDRFNIFDIFTTLIPGIIITSLFGITLSTKFYSTFESFGSEKYFLFFVLSYAVGVLFQEIGTLCDKLFIYKILYGGDPKEIYLLNNTSNKFHKIFNDSLSYEDALQISKDLRTHVRVDISENTSRTKLNSLIFAYCLSICEMKGLSGKADKMLVVSEMSRSLFWGCITTALLNLFFIYILSLTKTFLYVEIPFLLIFSLIFIIRKKRYEKYRIGILLRAYSIHIRQEKDKEELK